MSSLLLRPQRNSRESFMSSAYRPTYEQSQQSIPRADADVFTRSWFTGGLPTPPGTKTMMNVASSMSVPRPTYPSRHQHHPDQIPPQHMYSGSYHSNDLPHYPQPVVKLDPYAGMIMPAEEKASRNEIAHHLQIPESVNKSKGSLAEFAAEIASLFWFETAETLSYAEDLPIDAPTERRLTEDALPSIGFRKWVTTILSTTQVGKNVILLGLLFIYRLKQFNPGVSGKRGSEFRLLTIALMLGNKFLDDNTYTNKTWAEVSGISVTEIHIMEVEFLSNMRYDLYVSAEEWDDWKVKLGHLGAFYDKASKMTSRTSPAPATPIIPNGPHKLPSPPSARMMKTYLPHTSASHNTLPNPMLHAPQLHSSPLRGQRYASADILDQRKRSLDMSNDMPPAKRMHYSSPQHHASGDLLTPSSYHSGAQSISVPTIPALGHIQPSNGEMPKLPMPRIPVSTSSMNNTHLAPLNLPTSRAMSNVYPPSSGAAWSNPITPVSQNGLYSQPIPSLGDISRSQSNINSAHTSPNGYSTITPILPGLSPSYFLTNRSSPYRPVRHVNTLLIPPPSAAMQNPVRNIPHEQMHYQPLSKMNPERRQGLVPYHQQDSLQQNGTPSTQKYPYRF